MIKELNCTIPTLRYSQARKQLVDEDTMVFVIPQDWTVDQQTYVFSDMVEISKCPVIDPIGRKAVIKMSIGEVIESYPDAIVYPGARDYVKLQEIFSYVPF